MYFSRHKHLLSVPIMLSALARLACSTCRAIIRIIINRNNRMTPDMINTFLWRIQRFFSFFELVIIAIVFYLIMLLIIRIRRPGPEITYQGERGRVIDNAQ